MAVKPIPEGYHALTPFFTVQGVKRLLEFMKQAFDAKELHRMEGPGGMIVHAEVQIGDSRLMLGEPMGEHPAPMPGCLYFYVKDTDAVYKKALAAGATSKMEPADQFWGDRAAGVIDPSGNFWMIGTHVEDVAPDELERRGQKLFSKASGR
jgi:PhnB protein